jgi:hypothetical protein
MIRADNLRSNCTAGFSQEGKEASEKLIWPLFANEVTKVDEWIASFEKVTDNRL